MFLAAIIISTLFVQLISLTSGESLLAGLSAHLNERVGKGFSESTLRNARKFYLVYSPFIQQTASDDLDDSSKNTIQQTLLAEFKNDVFAQIGQPLTVQSYPFKLSWSHYLILMRIADEHERNFYEIESHKQQWTYRQLQRQYGSSLYERLALSRNKDEITMLASEGQILTKTSDMMKNPLVLEFLGMAEQAGYSESDLESAIISKLSQFLLELGKGFLFEARQKRFTFDEDHFIM